LTRRGGDAEASFRLTRRGGEPDCLRTLRGGDLLGDACPFLGGEGEGDAFRFLRGGLPEGFLRGGLPEGFLRAGGGDALPDASRLCLRGGGGGDGDRESAARLAGGGEGL